MTLNPKIKGFNVFLRLLAAAHTFGMKLRRNGWR